MTSAKAWTRQEVTAERQLLRVQLLSARRYREEDLRRDKTSLRIVASDTITSVYIKLNLAEVRDCPCLQFIHPIVAVILNTGKAFSHITWSAVWIY